MYQRLAFGLALLLCLASFPLLAQNVSISEDGAAPAASALLDLQSTSKGFLMPRMTQIQREAIISPATGLMVYQTDGTPGYYSYDGFAWSPIGGIGNLWSTNAYGIHKTTLGNVGIGTAEPFAPLHIFSENYANLIVQSGTPHGTAALNLRMRTNGPLQWGEFNVRGTDFNGQAPALRFSHSAFNLDYIALQQLVDMYADSSTVLKAYGDVRADGAYFGERARIEYTGEDFATDIVHVITDEAALYGLHVDLNNDEFSGTGVAAHVVGPGGTAIEGWSENGTGGQFGSTNGPALVTTEGNVGINTSTPAGQLTVQDNGSSDTDLLIESQSSASIGLRLNDGRTANYEQYWINGHNDGISIARQDYAEAPDGSWATSSYLPMVDIGGQKAMRVYGDAEISGEVQRSATGNANLAPIAYGLVRSNGNIAANTGNISCSWNSTYKRYEIDISDQNYFWLNFITQVTPMGNLRAATSSVSGKLLVYLYNNLNQKVQGHFQFVTFKP